MQDTNETAGLDAATALGATTDIPVDTMGDLAKALEIDTTLQMDLRKRLVSDLNRLFELNPAVRYTRPLGLIIEPMLTRLHSISTGLSEKRLANIKASVRHAIQHHHDVRPGATSQAGLRDEWARAYAVLPPPRNPARVVLSRVLQWGQLKGIRPDQFTSELLEQYYEYVRDILGDPKPLNRLRMVVKHWNASTKIVGWPSAILAYETPGRPERAVTDETMGPALVAELQDYLHFMEFGGTPGRERDPFDLPNDEDWQLGRKPKKFKPARRATIEGRRFTLRRALGLLAKTSHVPACQLSLRDLTVGENAAEILKEYRSQLNGNAAAPACETMVYALVQLGRYHKLSKRAQFDLDYLATSISEIGREAAKSRGPSRMALKNVARLKLIGPDQVKALYQLPAVLLQRVGLRIKSGNATTKDMIDAQIAVAITILLHVPLRAANLVSLEIGRQLVLPPTDTQESVLHFDYTVVKNSHTLDFKLPPDVTALIRKYMTQIQPYFTRTSKTPALFPGCENSNKSTTHLGEQITARVQTAIGVTMNQHLFRHLVALIYLRRNPGEYAAVQRLLGHKQLKTTLEYYCGVEVEALLAHVTTAMAKIKEEMGLDPNDMSKFKDQPKRKAGPESKPQIRRGFFSRPAAPVIATGSVVMGVPGATGQGLAKAA